MVIHFFPTVELVQHPCVSLHQIILEKYLSNASSRDERKSILDSQEVRDAHIITDLKGQRRLELTFDVSSVCEWFGGFKGALDVLYFSEKVVWLIDREALSIERFCASLFFIFEFEEVKTFTILLRKGLIRPLTVEKPVALIVLVKSLRLIVDHDLTCLQICGDCW